MRALRPRVHRPDARRHFELPLTQTVIGDALGLTPIHVNRVLRKLRIGGVMTLRGGALIIAEVAKLATVARFDDNHLQRRIGAAYSGHGD